MSNHTESLHTDLTEWEVGPFHAMLPGPMKLLLRLDGEVVVSAQAETGFLHRGLEKAFEQQRWHAGIPYSDRLDPEAAIFGELVFCLAVEEICAIQVPERAQAIRVILSELGRVSGHLAYLARVARMVGAETILHFLIRDREKILDLFELLTGARFALGFLRFGGVRDDVTEGFIERVIETSELIRQRLKEYNDLLSFNQAFVKRMVGLAPLSLDRVKALGVTGPAARASGLNRDERKARPYTGYEKMDFSVPRGKSSDGTGGSAHDRFIVRLMEILQSLEILKHATESLVPGPFKKGEVSKDFLPPRGEAYAYVEAARGLLGCHVVADGSVKPLRVQFRSPSIPNIAAIPEVLSGARLEDVGLILASMDISVAEADK